MRHLLIFFTAIFIISACGDEECAPLEPGDYMATLTLIKDECSLSAPPTIKILLKIGEENKLLQCGNNQSSSMEHDINMGCDIISTISVFTTSENISGNFLMTFICLENSLGYQMIGNKKNCTDEFDFFAEKYP